MIDTATIEQNSQNGWAEPRKVFFFDIDNCLYPKSYRIHEIMSELIDEYFQAHLELSKEESLHLHQRYYKDYGLALEGLVRHHKVDPLDFNAKVDDALPLEDIIKPNPALRKLLEDINRKEIKPWLFTNAYVTHGKRVVKLLGIEDLFEGITFCDYVAPVLISKPNPQSFEKAMREAGVKDKASCYFVDDSTINAKGAKAYGWKVAHLVEANSTAPPEPVGDFQIESLEELRTIFPEVFSASE